MWSTVNEHITDGTSGIAPNSSPIAIIVGTCSQQLSKAISVGKNSPINDILGIGEMPRRLKDMQQTMDDCSLLAVQSQADIVGTVNYTNSNGLSIIGTPLGTCHVEVHVKTGGTFETAQLNVLISGDLNRKENSIIIHDGVYSIEELGIALKFEDNIPLEDNQTWIFDTKAPTSSYQELERNIIQYLELYTPDFIFVAQEIDANQAQLFGELAEKLFENHKPCLFLLETNLKQNLSFAEAITLKTEEFASVNARFITVVCQEGAVKTATGLQKRSPSGLCAGHITRAAVNQSIGATNKFHLSHYELPLNWTNVESRALDNARFTTLRTYAGLDNLFWTNGRTFATDTSDYRYVEIVRTVFKAIRLARREALPYIQAQGNEIGIHNLIAQVQNALNTMVNAPTKELEQCNVTCPNHQDVANNGIFLNIELFGVPIIRNIVLNFMYRYQQ